MKISELAKAGQIGQFYHFSDLVKSLTPQPGFGQNLTKSGKWDEKLTTFQDFLDFLNF